MYFSTCLQTENAFSAYVRVFLFQMCNPFSDISMTADTRAAEAEAGEGHHIITDPPCSKLAAAHTHMTSRQAMTRTNNGSRRFLMREISRLYDEFWRVGCNDADAIFQELDRNMRDEYWREGSVQV